MCACVFSPTKPRLLDGFNQVFPFYLQLHVLKERGLAPDFPDTEIYQKLRMIEVPIKNVEHLNYLITKKTQDNPTICS